MQTLNVSSKYVFPHQGDFTAQASGKEFVYPHICAKTNLNYFTKSKKCISLATVKQWALTICSYALPPPHSQCVHSKHTHFLILFERVKTLTPGA